MVYCKFQNRPFHLKSVQINEESLVALNILFYGLSIVTNFMHVFIFQPIYRWKADELLRTDCSKIPGFQLPVESGKEIISFPGMILQEKCLLILPVKMICFLFCGFVKSDLIKLSKTVSVMHEAEHAYPFRSTLWLHRSVTDVSFSVINSLSIFVYKLDLSNFLSESGLSCFFEFVSCWSILWVLQDVTALIWLYLAEWPCFDQDKSQILKTTGE